MTNFYDQPMFESGNICDLGLLQNARTHGPRGTVKTIEKPILHMTQVHYFCSGNSNEDGETIIGDKPTYNIYVAGKNNLDFHGGNVFEQAVMNMFA